ncbi:MAG: tetratricopeptide repeat protein [Candidatus Omnitrophica bacterium]|nr:tetratricopeptide repeat protein [Candidatus Omnitrophota bacterium]
MKKKYIQYFAFIILICVAIYIIPAKIAVILNNKAFIAYNEKDYPLAVSLYKKAITVHPSAQTHFNLGCVYEKAGSDEQAILEFKQGAALDPEYEPAYKALSAIYAAKGDYEQAEDYLSKLQSIGAQDTQGVKRDVKQGRIVKLYNQGVRFYDMRQEEKALNNFEKVIKLEPLNLQAYKAAADIYSSQGNISKALRYYKQAVGLGLRDADAFNSMGIICMRVEDYGTGIKYFKKALAIDPGNLHYMYNLASTSRDAGHFYEALSVYYKVVDRSPRYPNIHNDLGGIYAAMRLSDKARGEYQKEHDIVSDLMKTGLRDKFTLTRLAVAYNGLNKSEEAKKILEDVIANNPNYDKAYYARGQVYNNLGKHDQSDADYLKARELSKNIITSVNNIHKDDDLSAEKLPKKRMQGGAEAELFKENSIIYLHNGHIVRGRIKQELDKKIILQIKTGESLSTITFQKSKIKKIKRID